jgi:hypothetical protein
MGIAEFVIGALLTVLGLYLTHSFRRQQSLRIAEKRVAAYQPLWQLTKVTRLSRLNEADEGGELTRDQAGDLRQKMVDWYYSSGNGMFLTKTTTEFYTQVRLRLGEYVVGNSNSHARVPLPGNDTETRAKRCMKDFSLMRHQMRLDLKTLSGRPSYHQTLNEEDKKLLRSLGIRNPENWGLPWYRRLRRKTQSPDKPSGRPRRQAVA